MGLRSAPHKIFDFWYIPPSNHSKDLKYLFLFWALMASLCAQSVDNKRKMCTIVGVDDA